ncbi:hypothetical protein SORBI_3010G076200 [Sorghum bicolor]|nr:hypothetical protein SORBI_3010G076200 [Sorghum bicolor]
MSARSHQEGSRQPSFFSLPPPPLSLENWTRRRRYSALSSARTLSLSVSTRAHTLLSLSLSLLQLDAPSPAKQLFANLHCVAPYNYKAPLSPPTSKPPFFGFPSLHHTPRDPPQPNAMVSGVAAFAYLYLCLAFAALELTTFMDPLCGAGRTSTTTLADEAPLHNSAAAAEVFPPLVAALVVFYVAVALTYRHLMMGRHVGAAVPVAGARNGQGQLSISGPLVMFLLCVSASTLELIVFGGQAAAGGGADHGALGLAVLRALPAAATVTFFCGMMLIIVDGAAHVRAGGEAAGGTGAVAGDGPIQGLILRLLTKIAAGAAAALVSLMAMAMFLVLLHGAK